MKKLLPVYKLFLSRMIFKEPNPNFDIKLLSEDLNYQSVLYTELLKVETLDELDRYIEQGDFNITLPDLDIMVRNYFRI